MSVPLPGLDSAPSNATLSAPVPPTFTDAAHGLVAVSVDVPLQSPKVEFFRTTDAGQTWTEVSKQLAGHFNQMAEVAQVADGSRLVTVAAQHLSVSADDGSSWQEFDAAGLPENEAITWIAFTDASNGVALVFVGPGPSGLMQTNDGGRTWHAANVGVRH